uniref:ATP-dependent dethiobiotin synthetase BioD n=1 Tax=Nocardia farcinica TaxID=37329 RepID=UPI002454D49F
MNTLLVTGTSTDVGKTVVTAALTALARAEGLAVAVCKPAQTGVAPGEPGDLAEVRRLAGPVPTLELARYPEPLAPDTAAPRRRAPRGDKAPTPPPPPGRARRASRADRARAT